MPLFDKNATYEEKIVAFSVELDHIYSNKSSDEYKMRGDITKSKMYHGIEEMLANLSVLKGYPNNERMLLNNMFNAIHRPIYKQMVNEYLHEKNERNIMFTILFTCGYRVLVAELSRIYASTTATEKGLVYKPNRISQKESAIKFIKAYNKNIEKEVDDYIRKHSKSNKSSLELKQESYMQEMYMQEDASLTFIGTAVGKVASWLTKKSAKEWLRDTNELLGWIFGKFDQFNPVSFINNVLTNHYDKKVNAFYATQTLFEETKKAYDEYMKIPESNRQKKVESKYIQNMKKYNIKMENLRAQIAHYDSRAAAEAKENVKKVTKPTTTTNDTSSSGGGDDELDW